jgi:hypothetical protein
MATDKRRLAFAVPVTVDGFGHKRRTKIITAVRLFRFTHTSKDGLCGAPLTMVSPIVRATRLTWGTLRDGCRG